MPTANAHVDVARLEAERRYEVVSIEKTEPPAGAEGSDWYRYVVKSPRSTITGSRRGSRQQVRRHAEDFAAELNARADGRGFSPWSARKKA